MRRALVLFAAAREPMSRRCTICHHPERAEIDRALIRAEPFRRIAERTGTSTGSLHRHRAEHLPALVEEQSAITQAAAVNIITGVAIEEARVALSSAAITVDLLEMRDTVKRATLDALEATRYRDTAELARQWHAADVALMAAAFKREANAVPDVPVARVVEALRAAMEDLPPEQQRMLARRIDEIEAAS